MTLKTKQDFQEWLERLQDFFEYQRPHRREFVEFVESIRPFDGTLAALMEQIVTSEEAVFTYLQRVKETK
jgi:hypothetical protein